MTGAGPIGLLAAQVARACGGEVARHRARPRRDPAGGGTRARLRHGGRGRPEGVRALRGRLGADVVVECSGSAAGATACLEAARRGGRYVQIGVFGRPVTVPLDRVFEKELVVTSGFASTPRSWRRALSLIERRSVELEPLVSDVVPLTAWERAFADLRAGRALKIVFDPRLA